MNDLGFEGLLLTGRTPEEAWQVIRDNLVATPDVRAIFQRAASTPDGRAMLNWSRAAWDRRGFPPPWAELLEVSPDADL